MEFQNSITSDNIVTNDDLLDVYWKALIYRSNHKNESRELAKYIFDITYNFCSSPNIPNELSEIRYEFGALEAPGLSKDDEINLDVYDNFLWNRLSDLVKKSKKNRTV